MTRRDVERRQRIVDFIARTVTERGRPPPGGGYPPSVREIADAVGLASTSAVHHHLIALERDGLLERGGKHSRALRPTARPRPVPRDPGARTHGPAAGAGGPGRPERPRRAGEGHPVPDAGRAGDADPAGDGRDRRRTA